MFILFHPKYNSFSAIWWFLYCCCCHCQVPGSVRASPHISAYPVCLYFNSYSCRWLHYTVFSFGIVCRRVFIDLISTFDHQWIITLRIKTVFAFCKETTKEISNLLKCTYVLVPETTDFAKGVWVWVKGCLLSAFWSGWECHAHWQPFW